MHSERQISTEVALKIPNSPDQQGRVVIVSHNLPFYCTLSSILSTANNSPQNQAKQAPSPMLTAPPYSSSPSRSHQRANSLTSRFRPLTASSSDGSASWRFGATPCTGRAISPATACLPSQMPPELLTTELLESRNLQWDFTTRRDHSALYAGILSAQEMARCVYIGNVDRYYSADGSTQDAHALPAETKQKLTEALLRDKKCIPIFLDPATSSGHYEGFCKQCKFKPLKIF